MTPDPATPPSISPNTSASTETDGFLYDNGPIIPPEYMPHFIAGSLLVLGFLMVMFAGTIGYVLVPKDHYSANSFGWSPDAARYRV